MLSYRVSETLVLCKTSIDQSNCILFPFIELPRPQAPRLDTHLEIKRIETSKMSAAKRVEQIAGHLNYPKGMLVGQVAIITGSGQGIGAEAARLFAKEGAKVVVSDIDSSMCAALLRGRNSTKSRLQRRPKRSLPASSQKAVRQSP